MHLPATRSAPTEGGKPGALFGWPKLACSLGEVRPGLIQMHYIRSSVTDQVLVQVHHISQAGRNRTLNRERPTELRRQLYDEPCALDHQRIG